MSRSAQPIVSLDDPRVGPYRNLKDRELARYGGRFIAEGEQVVRRLLDSHYPVESIFLSQRRSEFTAIVPEAIPVYVAPDALVHQVLGFKFHSGVIGCGIRQQPQGLDGVTSRFGDRATMMVLPEVANTENLGSLMRIAAGFGVDALVLGPQCCDPFYRQSIRVSMGAVFRLNIVQSSDLARDLVLLREKHRFELAAAVLDESAEALGQATRGNRLAILLGNEAQGLSPEMIRACDRRITIPMKLGTDSLNVAVAAAVFLFHFVKEPLRQ